MKGTLGLFGQLQQADKRFSVICIRERRRGPQYLASRMLRLFLPSKIHACSSQPEITVMIIQRPGHALAKRRPRLGIVLEPVKCEARPKWRKHRTEGIKTHQGGILLNCLLMFSGEHEKL